MKEEPQIIIDHLSVLMHENITSALNRYRTDNNTSKTDE